MHYDWVPPAKRKPLKWPNGKRLALMITINLEYWDLIKEGVKGQYPGGPSINPNLLPADMADYNNYTWREYGHRAGIWRLIDIFDRAGVPTTSTLNAKLCEERREIVDAFVERGWELVAHNYEQAEQLTSHYHDRAAEKEVIGRTIDIIEKTTGTRPRGWLSSSLRCTPNTPEIIAEMGLIYHCDFMNDDQPYLVHTDHGPLVEIPYTNEVNDFSMFMRRGMTASQGFELFRDQFDQLYAESAESGKLMNIGLHPHVTGQPYRARAIREFLDYVRDFDGVWWARREEIADWYLANHASHIS